MARLAGIKDLSQACEDARQGQQGEREDEGSGSQDDTEGNEDGNGTSPQKRGAQQQGGPTPKKQKEPDMWIDRDIKVAEQVRAQQEWRNKMQKDLTGLHTEMVDMQALLVKYHLEQSLSAESKFLMVREQAVGLVLGLLDPMRRTDSQPSATTIPPVPPTKQSQPTGGGLAPASSGGDVASPPGLEAGGNVAPRKVDSQPSLAAGADAASSKVESPPSQVAGGAGATVPKTPVAPGEDDSQRSEGAGENDKDPARLQALAHLGGIASSIVQPLATATDPKTKEAQQEAQMEAGSPNGGEGEGGTCRWSARISEQSGEEGQRRGFIAWHLWCSRAAAKSDYQ